LGLLASTSLTGCGLELDTVPELANRSQGLYISANLWPEATIPVCWRTPLPDELIADIELKKGWVREVLTGERSWSAHALIEFVGWGACAAGRVPGIEVYPRGCGEASAPAQCRSSASVGAYQGRSRVDLDFDPKVTRRGRCRRAKLELKPCVQAIALHEFGHALGFWHEHERLDAAPCRDYSRHERPASMAHGEYDESSIMGYCGGAELSAGDIAGVRAAYGPRCWP
jgi:hypothetical protein